MSDLAGAFADLKSDIVMLVGDRVEAFAAASAASVSGVPVAHIHGGDRALGQVDDMLRHAITKLSHIHFPATKNSAARLKKLGENSSRIHCVGSPGIDGIVQSAMSAGNVREKYNCPKPYSLLLLHPTDADAKLETRKVKMLLQALMKRSDRLIAIGPNNDAGSAGIVQTLSNAVSERLSFYPDVPRGDFLALMRDALFLIGNSSSGIIEAASFGTPVIDVGPRQMGREHGRNVMHSDWNIAMLEKTITSILKSRTTPKRFPARNIYGMGNTARKIATVLSQVEINQKLLRKIIAY